MTGMASGRSSFVAADGLTLHARADERGEGPALVYLNSLGSDLRIWDGVVERLGGYHLRHDLRGHGLSDAPAGPYSIGDMARDLRRVIDQAGLQRPIIVGISVGGLIALRFALAWPDTVAGLVICDSAARIGSAEAWNERIAAVEADGLDAVAPAVVARWFSAGFADRATLAGYRNMLRRTPARGYTATCAALRDEDLRGRVAEIDVPALVLCGSEDLPTPPEQGRQLASSLPRGRFLEIGATGHLPCLERPEAVAGAIAEFAAEVVGG